MSTRALRFLVVLVVLVAACIPQVNSVSWDYNGRFYYDEAQHTVSYDWSAVSFTITASGARSLSLALKDFGNVYNVYINGSFSDILTTNKNTTLYTIASGLQPTMTYSVQLIKRTEALFGVVTLLGVRTDSGNQFVPTDPNHSSTKLSRRIEFIGDSETCAYGNEGVPPCQFTAATENVVKGHAIIVAERLKAQYHIACWSGKGMVRNYGDPQQISSEPFPKLYPRTIANSASYGEWDPNSWQPHAVVVMLGCNDYSTQPQPSYEQFRDGYRQFLSYLHAMYPSAQLFAVCGALSPCDPCNHIAQIVSEERAAGHQYVHFASINGRLSGDDYGCAGHPNTSGNVKMADALEPAIRSVMGW